MSREVGILIIAIVIVIAIVITFMLSNRMTVYDVPVLFSVLATLCCVYVLILCGNRLFHDLSSSKTATISEAKYVDHIVINGQRYKIEEE